MKISVADLAMALAWLKQRSSDVEVQFNQPGNGQAWISALDADNQLVTIILFDANSSMEPKISTTAYLKHLVKKT